ncbi:MAG: hypothetical protein AAF744_09280 [Pseudomonadota bacterium]
MAENITNELLLEHLKQIQSTLAQHTQYHKEVRERLGTLEMQYASISRRVDRIDDSIERINKRLDISDAPLAGE